VDHLEEPDDADGDHQPEESRQEVRTEQPPEAAGMLAGARPFDAPEGSASDAIEFTGGDGDLCPDCRAELRGREP